MRGNKFLLYQIFTSILWIAWMSAWFIIEDIVLDIVFWDIVIFWLPISIWYVLQLFLPMKSKISKIELILYVATYLSIQIATWACLYLVKLKLYTYINYLIGMQILILFVNIILIQLFTVLIYKFNKKKLNKRSNECGDSPSTSQTNSSRKSNRITIFLKKIKILIRKWDTMILLRFRIFVFLLIFVGVVLNYLMRYGTYLGSYYSWSSFVAHWSSHILLILSFYRYFKRRLIFEFRNRKIVISPINKKKERKLSLETISCPNCNKKLDIKSFEFPEGMSSTKCPFCEGKILKVDVIPVDSDTLLNEHQKMIEKVNELGTRKSESDEDNRK